MNDSELVLVKEAPPEAFSATVTFSHGSIKIEGTMIFILATVAEQEKREGFKTTVLNDSLKAALAAAEERVNSRVAKYA
jgi:nucleoside-triphosphatase THEP1